MSLTVGVTVKVRTILSQNTTDTTSHRAFASLKEAFPTWEEVLKAPSGSACCMLSQTTPQIQTGLLKGQHRHVKTSHCVHLSWHRPARRVPMAGKLWPLRHAYTLLTSD